MKIPYKYPLVFSFLLFLTAIGFAQQTESGFKLKEEKIKTNVYEIRLTGLRSEVQAQYLDQTLLKRESVISSFTSLGDEICTLEAMKELKQGLITEVIETAGLGVAKTFDK